MILILTMLILGASAALAVPNTINYQGQLFLNGSPTTGPVSITFRLFAAPTGGTELWAETDVVTVTGGLFSTTLGDGTAFPANLFSAQVPWLEMEVSGVVLTPRTEFKSVPYALDAAHAGVADVALSTPAPSDLWSTDGTNVWRGSGNVGVGLSAPAYRLDVNGNARLGSRGQNNTALTIDGPNSPEGPNTAQDIRYSFESAGSAGIRAYRGLSWDTYLQFLTNGYGQGSDNPQPRMTIAPDGSVGIGTLSPVHALEVHSTTSGQAGFFHSTSTSGTNYGIDAGAQGVGATTNIGGYFYASGGTNNNAIIVPSGYGNVGIGTNNPSSATVLEVRNAYNGTAAFLRSDATSGTNIGVDGEALGAGAATNIGAWFAAGGAANNHAIIVPAGYGNVGIGTEHPTHTLEVVGDLSVSGSKCRAVEGTKYGTLYYNAVESGTADFSDRGEGQLVNGACHIELNPKWLAGVTIDETHPMQVTITAYYGPHGGQEYVERTQTGFTLVDPSGSNAAFGWKVEARQKGYEDVYLDRVEQTLAR